MVVFWGWGVGCGGSILAKGARENRGREMRVS